jgi:HK97 family phage portal protein
VLLRRNAPLEERTSPESPQFPLTSATLVDWLTGPRVAAGVAVNERKSLGMPAVWRAVQILSGSLASLPLHSYRTQDDARVPAGERSKSARLLRRPHPDLSPFEFWELAVCHVALWGNFYARKLVDENGDLAELWPLHPGHVQVGRAKGGQKMYKIAGEVDREGFEIPYTDAEIFHIPGMGYDGVCGVSPIRAARQGIGLALAAEEYGARLFGNGSLASGILQTEQRLTEDQATTLKERWAAKAHGLDNAHEVVVLDRGATFEKLTIPPDDAQFIESRKFQIDEIARMFGIPPHMLAQVDRSTSWGSGIEQQNIGFVTYTLRYWAARFEQRVSMHLLDVNTVYARFSLEGLLRGDTATRAEFYRAMWEIGAMSTNEIRALEDLPPAEGGDVHYRPLNMGKLGDFDSSQEPAQPAQEGVGA